MEREDCTGGLTAVEDRFAGYTIYDRDGVKIGKVDDLFLDESDRFEHIGVKMGFFGLISTVAPMNAVRIHEAEQAVYVEAGKEHVKNGPRFDDNEITFDFERQVREYYGLGAVEYAEERGGYGVYGERGSGEQLREAGAELVVGDFADPAVYDRLGR